MPGEVWSELITTLILDALVLFLAYKFIRHAVRKELEKHRKQIMIEIREELHSREKVK